jgi:SAM-dependent methyltransferase
MMADNNPDIVHDLRCLPMPFPENTFSAVLSSHLFEHLRKEDFLPLMADIHRVLRPGGFLIGITPYGTSFDSFENPCHLQQITEATYYYADEELCYREGTAGYGAGQGYPTRKWTFEQVSFVPFPEFKNEPADQLEWKRLHYLNIVQELHVIMKAVK